MIFEEEIKQYKFSSEYHKLMLNLIFTGNRINQVNTKLLKKWKLSLQQYNILRILRGKYPEYATVKDIQSRMLDKMSNASRLVEKLRAKELVDRCLNETDRREVKVTITSKGLELLKKIDSEQINWKFPDEVLTENEAIQLNNKLDKIREHINSINKSKRKVLS